MYFFHFCQLRADKFEECLRFWHSLNLSFYPGIYIYITKWLQPIRVVEQGNYHVIVFTQCSGVQHPMISMLFIS